MNEEEAQQERLRQQLEQLPPGLQENPATSEPETPEGEEQEKEPEQPRGFELAPSTGVTRRPSLNPPPEEPEGQSALEAPELPAALEPAEPPEDGILFASVTPRDPGGSIRLMLRPERPEVAVGEEFAVTLEVTAEQAVSHLPTTLGYDAGALELLDAEAGTFFGDTAEAQTLIDRSQPGRVVVGASRMGRTHGVAGRGRLLTLRFRALRPGPVEIGFEKKRALDAFLQAVGPLATLPAKVTVTAPGAPATPTVDLPPEAVHPAPPEDPGAQRP
jgi:hypothetical protein